jgi:NTE family protein
MGLIDGDRVMALIRLLTKNKRLEELDPPVWVVATNLLNGEEVVFTEGLLDLAVRASISIPGLFTPVSCENAFLVDGGVVAGVPVSVARRMEKDLVVAVNVSHDFKRSVPNNLFDVLIQATDIMSDRMDRFQIEQADLVINPNVGDVGTLEFHRGAECIERGIEAARQSLPAIRRLLDNHPVKFCIG